MAVWHYSFHLIPRSSEPYFRPQPDSTLDSYDFPEECCCYSGIDLEQCLGGILPKAKSWSSNIAIWGSEDDINVQQWTHNINRCSLYVTIDVRNYKKESLAEFLAVVAEAGLLIVTNDLGILMPTMPDVLYELQNSPAARFVEDPAKYLETFREGDGGPKRR